MPSLGTFLSPSSVNNKRAAIYGLITSLAIANLFSILPVLGQSTPSPAEAKGKLEELFQSVEQEGVDSISAPKQLNTDRQKTVTQGEKPGLSDTSDNHNEDTKNAQNTTISLTPSLATKDTTKPDKKTKRTTSNIVVGPSGTATAAPAKQKITAFRPTPISKLPKQAPPVRQIRLSDQNTLALAEALTNQNISAAQTLLQNGVDLGAVNHKGQTLLMMAVANADADLVSAMIERGANLNARDHWGWTALFHATIKGQLEMVNVLLEAGADPNLIGYDGRSATMAASWNRHHQILSLLVQSDANVNVKNRDGWTPLSFAAWNGDETAVRILLNATADKSIRTNEGESALMLAEQGGYAEIVNLLR